MSTLFVPHCPFTSHDAAAYPIDHRVLFHQALFLAYALYLDARKTHFDA